MKRPERGRRRKRRKRQKRINRREQKKWGISGITIVPADQLQSRSKGPSDHLKHEFFPLLPTNM
jgi:hypothetical protein